MLYSRPVSSTSRLGAIDAPRRQVDPHHHPPRAPADGYKTARPANERARRRATSSSTANGFDEVVIGAEIRDRARDPRRIARGEDQHRRGRGPPRADACEDRPARVRRGSRRSRTTAIGVDLRARERARPSPSCEHVDRELRVFREHARERAAPGRASSSTSSSLMRRPPIGSSRPTSVPDVRHRAVPTSPFALISSSTRRSSNHTSESPVATRPSRPAPICRCDRRLSSWNTRIPPSEHRHA